MSLKKIQRNQYIAMALTLASILIGAFFVTSLLSSSYVTAYEGAKATFKGLKQPADTIGKVSIAQDYYVTSKGAATSPSGTYGRMKYGEQYAPATYQFDSTIMTYDWYSPTHDTPNIVGEMTSIMIPTKETYYPPSWIPREWWEAWLSAKNPKNAYEWQIKNTDGTTSQYRMEEWVTKWYVSLTAEYDSMSGYLWANEESNNQRYHNIDIWFEFDISPSWYFNGTDRTYFAIAKIELSNFKNYGKDGQGNILTATDSLRVVPMSSPSALTIYTNLFGTTESEEPQAFYSFQGKQLNPLYFRDKVYSFISLKDFGTEQKWDWTTLKAKGDVATFGFTVTQFVVGEWKVQDIGDIPEDYGRTSKYTQNALGFDFPALFKGIGDWFSNPLNAFLFWFVLIFIVIVIILAVTGTLPIVLMMLAGAGRRRTNSRR